MNRRLILTLTITLAAMSCFANAAAGQCCGDVAALQQQFPNDPIFALLDPAQQQQQQGDAPAAGADGDTERFERAMRLAGVDDADGADVGRVVREVLGSLPPGMSMPTPRQVALHQALMRAMSRVALLDEAVWSQLDEQQRRAMLSAWVWRRLAQKQAEGAQRDEDRARAQKDFDAADAALAKMTAAATGAVFVNLDAGELPDDVRSALTPRQQRDFDAAQERYEQAQRDLEAAQDRLRVAVAEKDPCPKLLAELKAKLDAANAAAKAAAKHAQTMANAANAAQQKVNDIQGQIAEAEARAKRFDQAAANLLTSGLIAAWTAKYGANSHQVQQAKNVLQQQLDGAKAAREQAKALQGQLGAAKAQAATAAANAATAQGQASKAAGDAKRALDAYNAALAKCKKAHANAVAAANDVKAAETAAADAERDRDNAAATAHQQARDNQTAAGSTAADCCSEGQTKTVVRSAKMWFPYGEKPEDKAQWFDSSVEGFADLLENVAETGGTVAKAVSKASAAIRLAAESLSSIGNAAEEWQVIITATYKCNPTTCQYERTGISVRFKKVGAPTKFAHQAALINAVLHGSGPGNSGLKGVYEKVAGLPESIPAKQK